MLNVQTYVYVQKLMHISQGFLCDYWLQSSMRLIEIVWGIFFLGKIQGSNECLVSLLDFVVLALSSNILKVYKDRI